MKKSTLAASGVLVLALAAAAVGGWWWQRQVGKVEEAVRQRLVDPGSARFSKVRYHPGTRGGCGLVDAKNQAGQYIGFTPFVLDADGNVDTLAHTDGAAGEALYRREEARYCEGL